MLGMTFEVRVELKLKCMHRCQGYVRDTGMVQQKAENLLLLSPRLRNLDRLLTTIQNMLHVIL